MSAILTTFGHGLLTGAEIQGLLANVGLKQVVDVRRFPGSRHNPDASRDRLSELLADVQIWYRWDERLGGRRHLHKLQDEASLDTWWQVAAFRAYAAHTRTDEFRAGMADLIVDMERRPTAIMCSETLWWRCHRRIIADVMILEHGVSVFHLMPDGSLVTANPSPGARLDGKAGYVFWDQNP